MSLCGLGINQSQSIPCLHGKFLLLECCFLCSMEAQIDALHKQCIELKTDFEKKLDVDFNKWKEYFSTCRNDKKPYKCPVCSGSGGIKHPLTGLVMPAICNPCEGKGIIWG